MTDNMNVSHLRPEPLPSTSEEYAKLRTKMKPLVEYVEDLHIKFWGLSERYRMLREGVTNAECVTGKKEADDALSGEMLHQFAIDQGITPIAAVKSWTVAKLIRVVEKRHNAGRKQRLLAITNQAAAE